MPYGAYLACPTYGAARGMPKRLRMPQTAPKWPTQCHSHRNPMPNAATLGLSAPMPYLWRRHGLRNAIAMPTHGLWRRNGYLWRRQLACKVALMRLPYAIGMPNGGAMATHAQSHAPTLGLCNAPPMAYAWPMAPTLPTLAQTAPQWLPMAAPVSMPYACPIGANALPMAPPSEALPCLPMAYRRKVGR